MSAGRSSLPGFPGPGLALPLPAALPGYRCDTCAQAGEGCPRWVPGQVCGYQDLWDRNDLSTADGVESAMLQLAQIGLERTLMAALHERLSTGGMPDPRTGSELDASLRRLQQVQHLAKGNELKTSPRDEAETRPTRKATITLEEPAEGPSQRVPSPPRPRGLLAQLFSPTPGEEEEKPEETPPENGAA